MEYVFEDFIFGFIDKELPTINAKSQRSDTYLDEDRTFGLKPDLFLKTEHKSLIADTKYKIIYSNENDPKKGISQSDLYQMLAYAVRFNLDEILLFYPNTIKEQQENSTKLMIKDSLAGDKKIIIKAFQLPILNKEILQQDVSQNITLENLFESTKLELIKKIDYVFSSSIDLDNTQGTN